MDSYIFRLPAYFAAAAAACVYTIPDAVSTAVQSLWRFCVRFAAEIIEPLRNALQADWWIRWQHRTLDLPATAREYLKHWRERELPLMFGRWRMCPSI